MFATLNDAARISDEHARFFAPGPVKIWYMKPEVFRDFIVGDRSKIDVTDLKKSHVLLGEIAGSCNNEEILQNMQSSFWSPSNKAKNLIESKGLWHVSMTLGDIIQVNTMMHIATTFGFDLL